MTSRTNPIARSAMTRDPAQAALAVYRSRASCARCMASAGLRALRRDPGNDVLRRRVCDYRERFRALNAFHWRQRRRLDWMDFKTAYRARQDAKRRAI